MHLSDTDQNKYFCENKKNWNRYSERKGAELIGEKRGEKRGEKIGANKMRLEIVRNLLLNPNFSMKDIAEATKLSLTMVEKISKEKSLCIKNIS